MQLTCWDQLSGRTILGVVKLNRFRELRAIVCADGTYLVVGCDADGQDLEVNHAIHDEDLQAMGFTVVFPPPLSRTEASCSRNS